VSAAGFTHDARVWLTVAAFLVAAVVLFSYMVSCLRRHCSDDQHVA